MLCLWGDRARERVNGQFGIQWGYFCRCGLARAAAVVLGNVVSIGDMRGQARTYRVIQWQTVG